MSKIRTLTPPDMILIFVLLQLVLHFLYPIGQIISYPLTLFGILFIIIGIIPNLVGYFVLKKEKTSVKIYEIPNKLITSGFFGISRNPIYLGMTLILFGVAILLGSVVTFIFPIIFIILTDIFVVRKEEEVLRKRFGIAYVEYCKKVRRWV
ncbi:isoprenylcysteine carboxylmethyltransferase family protein [Candidatus Pacearchaeota archaeon]|nr:isoprenylcysteine carboxylmethyltransferase family protein [Candidatus Pacearchaeota archaeon]